MTASDRLFGTSISRWLAVFAAALLALTLLPATTAFGQEEVDDPQDACPEDPPPAPYTDRDEIPEVHVRNVDCVTHRNIALGFADGTYRPALPVPRDQMASFVARTLEEAGFQLPDGGPPPEFDDIAGNTHEDRINQLARAGIVEGGPEELPPTSYGPRRLVRRDQMASYLMRAAEWALEQDFGEDDQRFPDVPPGNVHFRNVNGAHEWNIALGYADGTYGPRDSTRRDQMASFLSRLLNFLETFEPEPEPTPEPTPEPELPDTQTFVVEPHETTVREVGATGGAVEYTASGLEPEEEYEIAVFPCGDNGEDATIKRNIDQRVPDRDGSSNTESGFFTFRDQDLDDVADNAGSTQNFNAEILTVGFMAVNATQTTAEADENGEIFFRVGVTTDVSDCAVPVVWEDVDGTLDLDLDEDTTDSWNEATDPYGIGGAAVFHTGEAETGYTAQAEEVVFINLAERFFVSEDGPLLFWGRDGDEYRYRWDAGGAFTITQARWEEWLSIGDEHTNHGLGGGGVFSTPYNRGGDTRFLLGRDDTPGTPINVMAEQGDDDDEIDVSWDYPNPTEGNINRFRVEMLEIDDLTTQVDTETTDTVRSTGSFDVDTEVTFTGVAPGRYVFRVEARGEGDDTTGDWSLLSAPFALAADDALIVDQRVTTDSPTGGVLDDGDEVRIRFDQEMVTDTSSAVWFRWQDDEGSRYQVHCTDQATCTWHAVNGDPDRELRMALIADPVHVGGPETGLDITGDGAFMTHVSPDIETTGGGGVDLENSPDRRLNVAAAL